MTHSSWKRWLGLAVKAGITIGLIWLLLQGFDARDAARRIGGMSPWLIPQILAVLVVLILCATWRWALIMRLDGHTLRFPVTLRLVLEGLFFNQTLPSTIGGDGVRMYRAVRLGIPVVPAVNGVVLDRVAGLAALLLMFAAAQPLVLPRIEEPAVRIGFILLTLIGIAALAVLFAAAWVPSRLRRWKLVDWVASLSGMARRLASHPATFFPVLALSLVVQMLTVVIVYLFARELRLPVTLLDCFAFVPTVNLLSAVPISIAGWGLREGVMVAAFGLVGVSQNGSLTLSVLFGLALVVAGLPGGVLWLTNADRKVAGPAEMAEMAEQRS